MDGTNARNPAVPHGTQQIEAVLQILLVDVNYIRSKRLPLARNTAGDIPIKTGGERAQWIIIGIFVIGTDYAGKLHATRSEFVHPRVSWNPHEHFVAAVG